MAGGCVYEGEGLQVVNKLLMKGRALAIDDKMQFPVGGIVQAARVLQEVLRQLVDALMQAITKIRQSVETIAGIDKNQAFHIGLE